MSGLLAAFPTLAFAQEVPRFVLHEALNAPKELKISGTFRPRLETLDGQFRPSPAPANDGMLSLQTTLFAEYDTGPVRIGGELFDSRIFFNRRNSTALATTEVNALELGQAYLGFDLEDAAGAGTTSTLTVGRFTQNIGSRRLVARNQYRNTINSFTGIRYDWQGADKSALRVFWTMPQYRLPDDVEGIREDGIVWDRESLDLQFYGASYTMPNILFGTLELYGYGLNERDSGSQLQGIRTRDRQLFTPGFRLFRAPKRGTFDHDVEAVYQTGTARDTTAATDVRDLPVSAYYFHLEGGYTFDAPWAPRLAAVYDHASGDGSNRNTYNRFDTLFGARRFDYGPTSLYGPVQRANLISPGIRAEVTPNELWDAFVAYRGLWLENPTDSFGATGIRDRTGNSGNFAGQQIEGRVRYWVLPKAAQIDAGVAYLIKGDFLRDAPNAPDTGNTFYGYLQLTYFF